MSAIRRTASGIGLQQDLPERPRSRVHGVGFSILLDLARSCHVRQSTGRERWHGSCSFLLDLHHLQDLAG